MRPLGTSEQLGRRRQRALGLLRQHLDPAEVGPRVGATAQSVRRWRREADRPPPRSRRPPGRPCRLSAAQQRQLVRALERGAYASGWAEEYWTVDRVAHLIGELFHVRYTSSGAWRLLQRLGWSCQKPQRRSLARDEAAVTHWKRYVWPQIKKVA